MRRLERLSRLAVLLALLGLVVPDASFRTAQLVLLQADTARGVSSDKAVIWLLALGSDARQGQPVLASRTDAIQLVGVNVHTGHATIIGVPRDSYVDIPGHGRDKINAAMVYGGPQLTAQVVNQLVGIRPDYVFVASFRGFMSMVHAVGGIDVRVRFEMRDLKEVFHPGTTHLDGLEALAFARIRKGLPRGDFSRSLNQATLLRAGLRQMRHRVGLPGKFEAAIYSFLRNVDTNVPPGELYRLGRAVLAVNPAHVRACVLSGTIGYAGTASVVLPNIGATRALAGKVRADATLTGPCH